MPNYTNELFFFTLSMSFYFYVSFYFCSSKQQHKGGDRRSLCAQVLRLHMNIARSMGHYRCKDKDKP